MGELGIRDEIGMNGLDEFGSLGESVSVIRLRDNLRINLSRPDLGHPLKPRLWDEIHYGNTRNGELVCGSGHPMSVRQLASGARWAYHLIKSDAESHGVSDKHKAMAEWLCENAGRHGLQAEIERSSANRSFRSDVLIHGSGGIRVGGEIQYSPAGHSELTPRSGMSRTNRMLREGVTPLWVAPDSNAANIRDRLPSAVFNDLPLELLRPEHQIPIISGPAKCDLTEHSTSPGECPRRRGGRCTGWHARLRGFGYDLGDMVLKVATGELVIVRRPARTISGTRTTALYYVAPSDRDSFLENGGVLEPVMPEDGRLVRTLSDARSQQEQDFTLNCARDDLAPVLRRPADLQALPVVIPPAYRPKQGVCAYADRDGCGDQPARRYMTGWRCERHK